MGAMLVGPGRRYFYIPQRASNLLDIKRATKQADAGEDLTGYLLWKVIEHIPRAVDAFNILFL